MWNSQLKSGFGLALGGSGTCPLAWLGFRLSRLTAVSAFRVTPTTTVILPSASPTTSTIVTTTTQVTTTTATAVATETLCSQALQNVDFSAGIANWAYTVQAGETSIFVVTLTWAMTGRQT
jgi:hypothetical protein